MRRNFTLSLAATVMMTLTAAVVNAQDAGNPWHLTASENDVEVAFYNTKVITGIEVTAQTVTVALANGTTFPHPVATTTFGFDPRAEGTGTANENIAATAWNVYYSNGSLNFSEAVNEIAIYTMYGASVAKFTGNYTNVPVRLNRGLYLVRAGHKSAKLLVGQNNYGSTMAQPAVETKTATYANDRPPSLRAGETIKTYWNITAGNAVIPVEMADVKSFMFTSDNSIVFVLKNGNTMELANYAGVKFDIMPITSEDGEWSETATFLYGGASYPWIDGEPVIAWSAVKKDGSIVYQVNGETITITASQITNPRMWEAKSKTGSRLSLFITSLGIYIGMSYTGIGNLSSETNIPLIYLMMANRNAWSAAKTSVWNFNGNSNIIPTQIIKSGKNIIMKCVDHKGVTHECTFY
jgi:hypothetical protein